MAKILDSPVEVGSLSNYLQGFIITSQVVGNGISATNSRTFQEKTARALMPRNWSHLLAIFPVGSMPASIRLEVHILKKQNMTYQTSCQKIENPQNILQ